MLQRLWLTVRLVVLALGVAIAPHLPQSSVQVLVLLVGVTVLAPLLARAVDHLVRALSLAPHAPPPWSPLIGVPVRRLPGPPGTPGAALVRAPSVVAPAFA